MACVAAKVGFKRNRDGIRTIIMMLAFFMQLPCPLAVALDPAAEVDPSLLDKHIPGTDELAGDGLSPKSLLRGSTGANIPPTVHLTAPRRLSGEQPAYTVNATNTKCAYQHPDRLFRIEDVDTQQCYETCASTPNCNYFSHTLTGQFTGVCMGCVHGIQDTHTHFTFYNMPSATTTTTTSFACPAGLLLVSVDLESLVGNVPGLLYRVCAEDETGSDECLTIATGGAEPMKGTVQFCTGTAFTSTSSATSGASSGSSSPPTSSTSSAGTSSSSPSSLSSGSPSTGTSTSSSSSLSSGSASTGTSSSSSSSLSSGSSSTVSSTSSSSSAGTSTSSSSSSTLSSGSPSTQSSKSSLSSASSASSSSLSSSTASSGSTSASGTSTSSSTTAPSLAVGSVWINEMELGPGETDVPQSFAEVVFADADAQHELWRLEHYIFATAFAEEAIYINDFFLSEGEVTKPLNGGVGKAIVVAGVAFIDPLEPGQDPVIQGFALVDPDGEVMEFLCAGGSFTAPLGSGSASGMTCTDIGTADQQLRFEFDEEGEMIIFPDPDISLQRVDLGTSLPGDWVLSEGRTPGQLNDGAGQVSSLPAPPPTPASTTSTTTSSSTGSPGAPAVGLVWINEIEVGPGEGEFPFVEVVFAYAAQEHEAWSLEQYVVFSSSGNSRRLTQEPVLALVTPLSEGDVTVPLNGGVGKAIVVNEVVAAGEPSLPGETVIHGFALVDPAGEVVEFICVGGSMTAPPESGSAAGMTCGDIGITDQQAVVEIVMGEETVIFPDLDISLQRIDLGTSEPGEWVLSGGRTPGQLNDGAAGQASSLPAPPPTPAPPPPPPTSSSTSTSTSTACEAPHRVAWFNEIDYYGGHQGTTNQEFQEIVFEDAGTDLTGWTVEHYTQRNRQVWGDWFHSRGAVQLQSITNLHDDVAVETQLLQGGQGKAVVVKKDVLLVAEVVSDDVGRVVEADWFTEGFALIDPQGRVVEFLCSSIVSIDQQSCPDESFPVTPRCSAVITAPSGGRASGETCQDLGQFEDYASGDGSIFDLANSRGATPTQPIDPVSLQRTDFGTESPGLWTRARHRSPGRLNVAVGQPATLLACTSAWINEIHLENFVDSLPGDFVEIFVPSGDEISAYTLAVYGQPFGCEFPVPCTSANSFEQTLDQYEHEMTDVGVGSLVKVTLGAQAGPWGYEAEAAGGKLFGARLNYMPPDAAESVLIEFVSYPVRMYLGDISDINIDALLSNIVTYPVHPLARASDSLPELEAGVSLQRTDVGAFGGIVDYDASHDPPRFGWRDFRTPNFYDPFMDAMSSPFDEGRAYIGSVLWQLPCYPPVFGFWTSSLLPQSGGMPNTLAGQDFQQQCGGQHQIHPRCFDGIQGFDGPRYDGPWSKNGEDCICGA